MKQSWGRLVRSKDFVALWSSQVLSAVGDQLYSVALVWTAVQLAGSAAGWVVGAQSLSVLTCGLLGGALADRWERRRVLLVVDLLRAVVVLALPLLLLTGLLRVWHLAAVGAVLGGLNALFDPALQASLHLLTEDVEELQVASAWVDSAKRLARVVGPGLTGVLLGLIPMPHFFTLDALTFLASAAVLRVLWPRLAPVQGPRPAAVRAGLLADARGLLAELRNHPAVGWAALAVALGNLLWGVGYVVALPLLVSGVFRESAGVYGLLVAAYGVGNVAGGFGLSALPSAHRVRLGGSGLVVMAAGYVLLATAAGLPQAGLGLMLAAVGGPMQNLALLALLQRALPPEHLGKGFSLYMVASAVGGSVGSALAALLFAVVPVPTGLLTCAGLMGAGGLAALALTRVRRMDGGVTAQPGPG